MPEKIQWMLNIQVVSGPRKALSQTVEVEAYDKLQLTIDGASGGTPGTKTVEMQPGGAGQVHFLSIAASSYNPPLTYKVDAGGTITLNAPLVLLGGAVTLLGTTQKNVVFTNTDSAPNEVEILIGRDATP